MLTKQLKNARERLRGYETKKERLLKFRLPERPYSRCDDE